MIIGLAQSMIFRVSRALIRCSPSIVWCSTCTASQPDYALGSGHAVTADGTLVIASASGSQLAPYAWGAANGIFVVGAQKLVPTLDAVQGGPVQQAGEHGVRAVVLRGQRRERGQHGGAEVPGDPDRVLTRCRVHDAMITGGQVTPDHRDPVTAGLARARQQ